MPHFADIILPVPLQGLFTYSLPADLDGRARVGSRVVVPFGTKKTQTGLIARLHDNTPTGIEVKAILEIMDEQPVVLPAQLNLWQWIADYYLCSIGEVFKAALPGKMKRADSPHVDSPPVDSPLPSRQPSPPFMQSGSSTPSVCFTALHPAARLKSTYTSSPKR